MHSFTNRHICQLKQPTALWQGDLTHASWINKLHLALTYIIFMSDCKGPDWLPKLLMQHHALDFLLQYLYTCVIYLI